MNRIEFQNRLHEQIPITKAMGFEVLAFSPSQVRVLARLQPNVNHMATAFGGSINCLMTVCGWSMMAALMEKIDPNAHIVIQKSSIEYLRPIKKDFIAQCSVTEEGETQKLKTMYERHGMGKLLLQVYCYDGEELLARYEGQYVAYL